MGNAFLFPSTAATYKIGDIEGLFWVPSTLESKAWEAPSNKDARLKSLAELSLFYAQDTYACNWIPCQYFRSCSDDGSRSVLLYFHGNSCDLGDMVDEMKFIARNSGRHVIHFEYPGYGICGGNELSPSAASIEQWARSVATFLIAIGVPPSHIIPFGRSIGTGPAAALSCWLLRTYKAVGSCILQSPYKSIHALVDDYARWVSFVARLCFNNDWDTTKRLKELHPSNVPLLIIHGQEDEVIPWKHGKDLFECYKVSNDYKEGVFPPESRHNSYYVQDDLVEPIQRFLRGKGRESKREPIKIEIPRFASMQPKGLRIAPKRSSSSALTHAVAPADEHPRAPQATIRRYQGGLVSFVLSCCGFDGIGGSPGQLSPDMQESPP